MNSPQINSDSNSRTLSKGHLIRETFSGRSGERIRFVIALTPPTDVISLGTMKQ